MKINLKDVDEDLLLNIATKGILGMEAGESPIFSLDNVVGTQSFDEVPMGVDFNKLLRDRPSTEATPSSLRPKMSQTQYVKLN